MVTTLKKLFGLVRITNDIYASVATGALSHNGAAPISAETSSQLLIIWLPATIRAGLCSLKPVVQIDKLYVLRPAISEYAMRGAAHMGVA